MTVKELIDRLQQMPAEATVRFAYDYGDHCHHMVAPEASKVVEEMVKHSNYCNEMVLLEDGDHTDGPRVETAVVIH